QTSVEDSFNYYLGKFDAQLAPVWGTYIGGDQMEVIFLSSFGGGLAVKDGGIYIAGLSQSDNFFDSPNPYQLNNNGEQDLLMMKFSLDGDLVWGSFFGGPDNEFKGSIIPTSDDTFYLIGATSSSSDISTPGAYQEALNKHPDASPFFEFPNGFIAKFAPDLSTEKHFRQAVSLYPNPTAGKVFIKGDFSGQSKIRVYDALGQKVFSKTIAHAAGTISLDLQSLSAGVYSLEFMSPRHATRKVIKKLVID